MLHKLLSVISGKPGNSGAAPTSNFQMSTHRRAVHERDLIRREAKIGATLFGSIPAGHNREFFCFDRSTWIWSEQWYDETSKSHKSMNVRYEFQPRGVLKIVDNIPRGYVEGKELAYLLEAIYNYHERVTTEIYGLQPAVA